MQYKDLAAGDFFYLKSDCEKLLPMMKTVNPNTAIVIGEKADDLRVVAINEQAEIIYTNKIQFKTAIEVPLISFHESRLVDSLPINAGDLVNGIYQMATSGSMIVCINHTLYWILADSDFLQEGKLLNLLDDRVVTDKWYLISRGWHTQSYIEKSEIEYIA